MTIKELENLAKAGQLKPEAFAQSEFIRNAFEYEGSDEVTEDLSRQVVQCAIALEKLL